MDAFTLLDIQGASNRETEPRGPNVVVEITRVALDCRLALEWDEMFAKYVMIQQIQFGKTAMVCSKINIINL